MPPSGTEMRPVAVGAAESQMGFGNGLEALQKDLKGEGDGVFPGSGSSSPGLALFSLRACS